MAQMSVKLHNIGRNKRIELLNEFYSVKPNREIALMCGVHERTIDRDIQEWKDSGEYDAWLDERWHQLLEDEEVPKTEKFKALTRLKEKRMTQRISGELREEITETHRVIHLHMWKPEAVTLNAD